MTVNLALTQQWLQLPCIHCKCGAEPFTFSCSLSGCHCHCVLSLGTCCHLLACFSPLTSAPALEPNLRELEGGVGACSRGCAGQGRKSALCSPSRSIASCLPPLRNRRVTLFHSLHPSSADRPEFELLL